MCCCLFSTLIQVLDWWVREDEDNNGKRRAKGTQTEQSAAQKYRSIIANPELTQYMVITYRATGILILIIHMRSETSQALAVKQGLSLVLLTELQSKN